MTNIFHISATYEPTNDEVNISFIYLPHRGALQPEEAEFNDVSFFCDDQDLFDRVWLWADWWVEQHQAECLSVVFSKQRGVEA